MRYWNSLTPRPAFLQLQDKGHKAFAKTMQVQWMAEAGETAWHIGLTVSSRHGNAVVRNRIKRRLRHVCDALMQDESLKQHHHGQQVRMVIIARQGVLEQPSDLLLKDLRYCLRKIGVAGLGGSGRSEPA